MDIMGRKPVFRNAKSELDRWNMEVAVKRWIQKKHLFLMEMCIWRMYVVSFHYQSMRWKNESAELTRLIQWLDEDNKVIESWVSTKEAHYIEKLSV